MRLTKVKFRHIKNEISLNCPPETEPQAASFSVSGTLASASSTVSDAHLDPGHINGTIDHPPGTSFSVSFQNIQPGTYDLTVESPEEGGDGCRILVGGAFISLKRAKECKKKITIYCPPDSVSSDFVICGFGFPVSCRLDPNGIEGTIIPSVTPEWCCVFHDVPPGTYTLKVQSPDGIAECEITVIGSSSKCEGIKAHR
jgi:hypothetical protein